MKSPLLLDGVLFAALIAAKKAGDAILEIYGGDFSVEHKEDRSPLTQADKRSHEIITRVLSSAVDCSFPILSEEGKGISYEERKAWECFWLVDPLDGTKEFIKRNGEFTVNIAFIRETRPVLGVIHVPVKNVLYFGVKGMGSFTVRGTTIEELPPDRKAFVEDERGLPFLMRESARLPVRISPNRRFTAVASRSHPSKETEEYINGLRAEHGDIDIISAGSSLKFSLVAEGRADVYPRFGPTMEWDTAAGQILVEQAGGTVVRMDSGETLQYNKKNLLNAWFLASSNSNR